jgi:hypothetical protein
MVRRFHAYKLCREKETWLGPNEHTLFGSNEGKATGKLSKIEAAFRKIV